MRNDFVISGFIFQFVPNGHTIAHKPKTQLVFAGGVRFPGQSFGLPAFIVGKETILLHHLTGNL